MPRRKKTVKGSMVGKEPVLIELEKADDVNRMKWSKYVLLHAICPEMNCSVSLVLRNVQNRAGLRDDPATVAAKLGWSMLKDALEPGHDVVFRHSKATASFRVEGISPGRLLSEQRPLEEAIMRACN
ncbi:MAG: hypothetical protein AB1529_05425 [Candidatus Micrarchaeota archaeon]